MAAEPIYQSSSHQANCQWSNTRSKQSQLVTMICVNPTETTTTTVSVKDPPDVLDRQKCLDALAALRHAKWFQVGHLLLLYFAAL